MNPQNAPEGPLPPADSPHLRVLSQYVKELSFRNAMAAAASQAYDVQPTIDMGVEVKSRPMGERNEAVEVDLCINVQARRQDAIMFSVDLVYSGLFQFMNVRADDVEPLIWIECPRLLFPFGRQILAEITREGGYPPLLINPIDFTPLYWSELRERQERAAAAEGLPPQAAAGGAGF
ncbi:protein-export chaperone SecB [Vitreimonas flagellata]|uniref:protein-export chaperone SecB n=1 Tax=Vitreimonas flagellata TaxID=2560861 RepID=UPI00107530F6|nr:protein-export chaperone SecB [Vitreimonas flagellata]